MRRKALYSPATRTRRDVSRSLPARQGDEPSFSEWDDERTQGPSILTLAWRGFRRLAARHERVLAIALSVLITLGVIGGYQLLRSAPRALTRHDIDNAVRYSLAHQPQAPAVSARAAAVIAPDVVEVEGFLSPAHAAHRKHAAKHKAGAAPPARSGQPLAPSDPNQPKPDAIGSGVVVTASGEVLTALHVVASTDHWVVVFADGSKSSAALLNADPQNDLAVLQPRRVPKGLKPAVLSSLAGVRPGNEVVATGFPFGVGPSVTAGVVSGLNREFVGSDNPHVTLKHLIQFDAAVNPGNSGGPLVNRDGEVIGIVSGILNPTGVHAFDGIGFAVPIQNAMSAVGENPL